MRSGSNHATHFSRPTYKIEVKRNSKNKIRIYTSNLILTTKWAFQLFGTFTWFLTNKINFILARGGEYQF